MSPEIVARLHVFFSVFNCIVRCGDVCVYCWVFSFRVYPSRMLHRPLYATLQQAIKMRSLDFNVLIYAPVGFRSHLVLYLYE